MHSVFCSVYCVLCDKGYIPAVVDEIDQALAGIENNVDVAARVSLSPHPVLCINVDTQRHRYMYMYMYLYMLCVCASQACWRNVLNVTCLCVTERSFSCMSYVVIQ